MRLDAATFLLQWATGGLAFLWFTLRSQEISSGYSKLLRGVFGSLAAFAAFAGFFFEVVLVRELASITVALIAFATITKKSAQFDLFAVGAGVFGLIVSVMILPTGTISVLNGSIDDGWDGILGYFWVGCASLTGVLAWFTRAALKERSYSAVMAATGLSYLAILTAFGTDLVARALLAI